MTPKRFSMCQGVLLCAALLVSQQALAGRSCEAAKPPATQTVMRGLNLAERTLAALDASGQRVVMVLARAGLAPPGQPLRVVR